jgi:hypothetical protein
MKIKIDNNILSSRLCSSFNKLKKNKKMLLTKDLLSISPMQIGRTGILIN